MKIDEELLDQICKACGKEEDPILKQKLCLLCLALQKPIDLVNVLIEQYSSLKKTEIVESLYELKKRLI